MRVSKALYLDDGVSVSGVLVKRFLHRPVFFSLESNCGWHSQIITKSQKDRIVLLVGEPRIGKVRCYSGKEEGGKNS